METNITVNWKLPRPKAIMALNLYIGTGLANAKLVYEMIDYFVQEGFNLERDSLKSNNLSEYLAKLNREGIIDFNIEELEDKVEQFEEEQKEKELEEANKWYQSLPEKEQRMVQVLQWSMVPSAR